MKGDMKAAIIAEYERGRGSVEQVRAAVGSDSYDYVSFVLRVHRGEIDARTDRATAEAHDTHLAALRRVLGTKGFPYYPQLERRAA